jgi:hypothetical protein
VPLCASTRPGNSCGGRYEEVAHGLRRLTRAGGYAHEMTLTPEEFEAMAAKPGGGSLLDVTGALSAAGFDAIIRHHLAVYVQRQVCVCASHTHTATPTDSSCFHTHSPGRYVWGGIAGVWKLVGAGQAILQQHPGNPARPQGSARDCDPTPPLLPLPHHTLQASVGSCS